jgi:membrane fusion protein, copper/silver efflux system
MKRILPWLIAAGLAIALAIVLFGKRQTNEINGVTQDNSGRQVIAWVDPMISQGPPHTTRSNHPGRALDCGMKLVPLYADQASGEQRAASKVAGYANVSLPPAAQQRIGLKLARADVRDLSRTTRTAGRVAVDERRLAQVRTKFDGFVEQLYVNFTGETVRRGQPLLSVYSPDVLSTENELILAARSGAQFRDTLVEAARRRLLLWDMAPADIDRVVRTGKPVRSIVLRSPVDGVVLTKNVTTGTRVMPTDTLYDIGDLSRVWILADIYESDIPHVRIGQTAQVSVASVPGRNWLGRVTFVSPTLDPATRTAKVRIELDNPSGILKPDMFAAVLLQEPIGPVVAVPESAVLETGTRSIVFVGRGNGEFEPREVTVGSRANGSYEIRSGVAPGETVAVEANFLIDSESRLKAAVSKMVARP